MGTARTARALGSELERAIGRVVEGVRHWSPARWSAHADAMRACIQALADVTADAEARERRRVPLLPNAMHLPDQLQVIGLDLIEAEAALTEAQRDRANAAIAAVRAALF